ncbi:putative integral membrane protein [Mycolicibacterium aurum]|uniref:Putative integral membrane protein n=2 Tax=Mycolicibacterium aurum TaxID=1791 RepID=A0A448IV03_MYCAU|nr:putative integral membrane protein [Mycolicibacterium aurum]
MQVEVRGHAENLRRPACVEPGIPVDAPIGTDSLFPDMRIWRSPDGAGWGPTLAWRLFQVATLAALVTAGWRLLGHVPYRIDIDVYRMGGRAWLDNQSLYADGVMFQTRGGLELPFTYPPLAAVAFAPFALLSLEAASVAITVTTLILLVVSTVIVLTRLDVWSTASVTGEPAWVRRSWLAAAIVAPAVIYLEPLRSNFDFGQINVVLMTLVIADCVPRRTPWPRGVLLGVAIALKLTPAVFLLYFLLRRDTRALLVTAASVAVATLVGFAFAWRDSWEYWTETVRNTDRIGSATLNTNQNIAGVLARLGMAEGERFALWTALCFAVLGVAVWAARRALRAGQPVLALISVAMFGLVVSPVSWSHHWVWALPTVLVTAVLAVRLRHVALGVVATVGLALMVWTPITLMPEHRETTAPLWRQLAGGSYMWWALATIVVAGTVTAGRRTQGAADTDPAVPAANALKA